MNQRGHRYRDARDPLASSKAPTSALARPGWLDIQTFMTNNLVMNKVVTLAEAKAHLSTLISAAEAGAEITVTRHGKPVARIVGAPTRVVRIPGDWGWSGTYDKSIFAPMTDDEMREEGWPV